MRDEPIVAFGTGIDRASVSVIDAAEKNKRPVAEGTAVACGMQQPVRVNGLDGVQESRP